MPFWESTLPTQFSEFVEIFSIAVLVYLLLRLVRGTMAASILRGAIILVAFGMVVAAFLVTTYDMVVLGKILATLAGVITTALLIVFQPEMRRGLLSLGDYKLMQTWAHDVIGCEHEIVRAIEGLVKARHGALFCIERRNALNDIARTGVLLNADANAELLTTIFWPGNPLHDGGVVIRGDRIVAAACILPVTARRDLAVRLGTRHRAGIGLSEESDAIVVIVSEETGQVSIAVEGQLSTVDDLNDLADRLQRMHGQPIDDRHSAAEIALSGSATQIVPPPEVRTSSVIDAPPAPELVEDPPEIDDESASDATDDTGQDRTDGPGEDDFDELERGENAA